MKRPAGFPPATGRRPAERRSEPAAAPAPGRASEAAPTTTDRAASIADLVGLARANRDREAARAGAETIVDRDALTQPLGPDRPAGDARPDDALVYGPKTHVEAIQTLGGGWRERAAGWRERARARRQRRKVERAEVRRFTKRSRIRRRIQLIGAAVVVAVIGGAVLTAFSPVMALKTITVEGTDRLKASDIQHALAGELGKPLPLVNLDDVRRDLDDFSLIRSYSAEVHPPSTLVVRIDERTPLGVVRSGASYELVDQAGVVISATAKPPVGYPTIRLAAGQQPQTSPVFGAVAAVLADLPPAVSKQVRTASATSPDAVSLGLKGGKTVIWGGATDAALKAAVLKALLKGAPHQLVYNVSAPTSPVTRTDAPTP